MQETFSHLSNRHEKDEDRADSIEYVRPSVKVVVWEHVAKNTELAAQAVADCDVVAMEASGAPNEKARKKFDDAATMYVSSGGARADMRKAERVVQRHASPAMAGLLEELKGSDKRIVTIDANEGDSALQEFREGIKILDEAGKSVHYMPSDKTKELLNKGTHGVGRGNARREALDVEQLQEILASYEGKDVKIGVLVGTIHTPVLYGLAKHYPTERRHIQGRYAGQLTQESHYFDPFDQMARHHNLLPDKPIPEALANRAILHTTQLAAMGRGVAANNRYRARRFENIPDEKISDMVLALDGMKSRVRARLQPMRTLGKMDAEIEKRLIEIEQKRNS